MKERPILFSGPLVRALIAGTKTQTRRPAKGRALEWLTDVGFTPEFLADPGNQMCPYGVPGDRLWVKERHILDPPVDGTWPSVGDTYARVEDIPAHYRSPKHVIYHATVEWSDEEKRRWRWRPSIHMPRWASRLTLEITDVRVQRLQEITPEDAIAEGVIFARCDCSKDHGPRCAYDAYDAVQAFAAKWREIYGDASWDASPWVWALTFKVVKA